MPYQFASVAKVQRQSLEGFHLKSCSEKFRKIQWKKLCVGVSL